MVQLHSPNPSNPVAGERFSITARDGVGPFTFTVRIDDEPAKVVQQDDPDFKITLPAHSGGETLEIEVTDDSGESDKNCFSIEEL